MPDEGLESFLYELRPRLFGIVPGGKRANLNAIQVVVSVRVSGGHEEYLVTAPFQDLQQGFGILLSSRSRIWTVNPAPVGPTPEAAVAGPPGTGCFAAFAGDEGGAITGDGAPEAVSGFFSLGDN